MAISDAEIQSLRFHLGYGNLHGVGSNTYTPDGFYELFTQVVQPELETGAQTTSSTAATAGATAVVTVGSITDIAAYSPLVCDVADEAEVVIVKSVSGSTFTAKFAKDHAAGFPVAVMSGESRLRILLWDADTAWKKAQNSSITSTAGLKSLGQGEIEWFGDSAVLGDTLNHYKSIVRSIADLVRVRPAWESESGRNAVLEAY